MNLNLIPMPQLVTPRQGTLVLGGAASGADIRQRLIPNRTELGDEGYELDVSPAGVELQAAAPAGLFRGTQTLRQLLPVDAEAKDLRSGPWVVPCVSIVDRPRFEWRGVMLDVARHHRPVAEVKRFIDLAALYKINVLHLHLTDDQGWRIEIRSWPRLTSHGGSTEVGGGPGGWYSQADFGEIVRHAGERHMTVVPEIDLPGHTNAALASYPELTCDGRDRALYTGTDVGFSALCVDKDVTYHFIQDVIGELAAMTPGGYLHVGGDECKTLRDDEYVRFVERLQHIVQAHGKQMVGWEEISRARLAPDSVVQWWQAGAAPAGTRMIMSPAARAYLDMKYTPSTRLGTKWAGFVEVADAYRWDPVDVLGPVAEEEVLGVEAPLWSETIRTIEDAEFLAFPRLPGVAEIGWSPASGRSWDEYRLRLAAHGQRWAALGVSWYRSPQVPWDTAQS